MFEELEKINERPEPFQFYTVGDVRIDQHTSRADALASSQRNHRCIIPQC